MPVECAECGKVLKDRRGAHGHIRLAHDLEGEELNKVYARSLELEFEEPEDADISDVQEDRFREIAREEAEKVLRENADLLESVSGVDPSDEVPEAPDPSGMEESAEESSAEDDPSEETEAVAEEEDGDERDGLFTWS